MAMESTLTGIGISRGIAIGRVHRIQSGGLDIPERNIAASDVDTEIERYQQALSTAVNQLKTVLEEIPDSAPGEISAFIDTHLLMLEDHSLSDAVNEIIRDRLCNAEWALRLQRDDMVAVFDRMSDPYLRSRRDDVEQVVSRVQRILLRDDAELPLHNAAAKGQQEPSILVADDITPADIIQLNKQGMAGFITEYGGPLSHTAILARSLGIPALVGVHNARRMLQDGELVIVDGRDGLAILSPDSESLDRYLARQREDEEYRKQLIRLKNQPAVSIDGIEIILEGNIELPSDCPQILAEGCNRIGLFRTEFLYMNRRESPSEEEQFEAYKAVIDAIDGPVTIRTLDLGADKQVDSGRSHGPTPNNPALGLRAIRLCLKDQPMFRVQLRALLRASVFGDIRIMLPMISSVAEFRKAQRLIEEVKQELDDEGIRCNPSIAVGAMIEVPAAALAAAQIARVADFFSIGTNDLIQYTLAIDRVDDEVNYLYDPLHPGVLRLIAMTIESGEATKTPVAMCGEMAGDPAHTRLLLALGLTEFSMHPSNILEVKHIIRNSRIGRLRELGQQLLSSHEPAEISRLMSEITTPDSI